MIHWLCFILLFITYGVYARRIAPHYFLRPKPASYWLALGLIHALWISGALQEWLAPLVVPAGLRVLGLAMIFCGNLLTLMALAVNPAFTPAIERPAKVVKEGIYRYRHPGYIGMTGAAIGYCLLLGSTWAAIPAGLYILLLARRVHLENKLLYR